MFLILLLRTVLKFLKTLLLNVFEKIKSTDKEIVILPESEHCLLVPSSHDDLTPNFVYIKILDWLDKH